ncbi:MAG: Holliday junction branch migration protein RuvA [Micromonosporaceae bacterium]
MIASVRGQVAAVAPDHAVVEVAGVGFAVQCGPNVLARLRVGQEAQLSTSLVVREDSLTLYGFADPDERSLFELLQTASGVGPKLAQAILATLSPQAVRQAVASADISALTRVSGVGKKGAERLVLELRDRIGAVEPSPADQTRTHTRAGWQEQVRQALVGLGWSAQQAATAVDAVAASRAADAAGDSSAGGEAAPPDISALLKQAIRMLGRVR